MDEMPRGFEEIPHTADVALRVWGHDLAALFSHAAQGMAWLMTEEAPAELVSEVLFELNEGDTETLLVAWLEELLYLSEREGCLFTDFELDQVTATHLRGMARGGPSEIHRQIKAVTFNDLHIRPLERGWQTTIVFDV